MRFLILTALLLAGCGETKIAFKPITAKVPVAVPCLKAEIPEPTWNLPTLPKGAADDQRLAAILADLDLAHADILRRHAAEKACVAPPKAVGRTRLS